MSRDDAAVLDMLRAARAAVRYVEGVDQTAYLRDSIRQLAIERLLEIVGEAAKRVSEGYRADHPEIPWRRAAGLRDVISHEYDSIDLAIIWNIVNRDLPELVTHLESVAPREGS